MKTRIPYLVAGLLAAGAVQHTLAQAPADDPTAEAPTVPYVPAWIPKGGTVPAEQREGGRNLDPGAPLTYVAEPAATASRTTGLDGELAASIAGEITADPAMKNAKITVQPIEDNKILLTGSAQDPQQVQRAGEIAKAHAGEGLVVNAILDIET